MITLAPSPLLPQAPRAAGIMTTAGGPPLTDPAELRRRIFANVPSTGTGSPPAPVTHVECAERHFCAWCRRWFVLAGHVTAYVSAQPEDGPRSDGMCPPCGRGILEDLR